MKLLFVADLHYALKQFDWLLGGVAGYDAVIIGGDLVDLASPVEPDVQIVVIEKYLQRLARLTRVLVISGNHDGDDRTAADESVARWIQDARDSGILVDGDTLELNGVLVTLCPWWDGPASRAELAALLERESKRPRSKWVWVHHAPPAGSPVCWSGKKHIGDEHLLEWIRRYTPDVVLSGHIHNSPFYPQGSWVDRIGATWVFNPGKQIGSVPTSISLDLAAMRAEWVSVEGPSVRDLAVADGGIARANA